MVTTPLEADPEEAAPTTEEEVVVKIGPEVPDMPPCPQKAVVIVITFMVTLLGTVPPP